MPRQSSGLRFVDRIAAIPDGGFLFRCQRGGHGEVTRNEKLLRDAKDFRASHDAEEHSASRRPLGLRLTLKQALEDFVAYNEELERAGKRDAKTVKFYRDAKSRLVSGMGERMLGSIDGLVVRRYILERLNSGSTGGARIVKELKTLEKVARDRGVILGWRAAQFVDEIRPARREKRLISSDQMMRFVGALDEDARDFAFAKLRTVMRNEELYALRVGDVNLEDGVINYVARAKRINKSRSQVIASDLKPVLERRCKDKTPQAFVFTCRGRQAQQSSFRKACIRASVKAEINPVITSLSFIRHNVLTTLRKAIGLEGASDFAGHSTIQVIEQHYDLDVDKLEEKKKAAKANELAFPSR